VNDARRRFFFVHLQKTAGTALFRRLRHHFGTRAVYPLPEEQGTPEVVLDVGLLQRRLVELGDGIEVVTGHFPLCATEVLPGPFATFTILRDPVERTLSFLRHQREVDQRFAQASLEEVYAHPVSTGGLVTNHMVKMLAMSPSEMTDGALSQLVVDDDRLAVARRNLAERIDVMGLQEHFDEFCADLETSFGWDLGPPVFMNRTTPADAPDGLREQIRADNDHDVRLYAYAVELWQRRHPPTGQRV
jgi:hypothetical protein